MALTASDLIESARDYHADFVKEVVPDKLLLRQLGRIEKRLYAMMTDASPDRLMTTEVYDRTDMDSAFDEDAPGLDLPDHLLVASIVAVETDGGGHVPVTLIAKADMPYRPGQPTAYLEGNTLVLVDDRWYNAQTDGWEDYDAVRVTYIPATEPLIGAASVLTIPDEAGDAIVAHLALFMATRLNLLKELPNLSDEVEQTTNLLLSSTQSRDATTSWIVRIV